MRKPWTQNEDQCLKMLRNQLKINKWSEISRKMAEEFGIVGRSQKQCRQRYHNHLDSSIKNGKLTKDKEIDFFQIHDEIGNRWSLIASHFTGLTDNYLKNIFHSKLRGAIRKLNRSTKDDFNGDYKLYPLEIVYRLIETCEKNKGKKPESADLRTFCMRLKNKLLEYNGGKTVHRLFDGHSEREMSRELMSDLSYFESQFMAESVKEKTVGSSQTMASYKECSTELNSMTSSLHYDGSEKSVVGKQLTKQHSLNVDSEHEPKDLPVNQYHSQKQIPQPSPEDESSERIQQTDNQDGFFLNPLSEDEFSAVENCYTMSMEDQSIEMLPMPFSFNGQEGTRMNEQFDQIFQGLEEDWFECFEG